MQFFYLRILVTIVTFGFVLVTAKVFADESRYCGIYSIYGAANAVGGKNNFEMLLSPEFVSSQQGSTDQDLIRAAKQLGVNAYCYRWMSDESLRISLDPLVLHLSPRGRKGVYTHWALFLGIEDNEALMMDGPGGTVRIPLADVLSRWDGIAVCVFRGESPTSRFASREILRIGVIIFCCVGLATLLQGMTRRFGRFRDALSVCALFPIAVFLSFAFVSIYPDLFMNKRIRESLSHELGERNFRELDTDTFLTVLSSGRAAKANHLLLDCRYERDFEREHLRGSQNLAVDTGLGKLHAFARTTPKNTDIILYCQSAGCRFADSVATELWALGFERLRIFRPGIQGLRELEKSGISLGGIWNAK